MSCVGSIVFIAMGNSLGRVELYFLPTVRGEEKRREEERREEKSGLKGILSPSLYDGSALEERKEAR